MFGSLRGADDRVVDRDLVLVDRVDELRFGVGAGSATTGGGAATGSGTLSTATGLPDQSVSGTDGAAAVAPMIRWAGAGV